MIEHCFAMGLAASVLAGITFSAEASQSISEGAVLLLGDSIFDIHSGDRRLEAILKCTLDLKLPHAQWTVCNHARGGEYIGPKEGDPQGTSGPLFTDDESGRYFDILRKCPQAGVVVINYVANDSKVYSPTFFRARLEFLCSHLERDFPGCTIILSTGMYLDPKHSARYRIALPKAPGFKNGSSRNEYLKGYVEEIRGLAFTKGYLLADVQHRMKEETAKGNWDFRVRAGNGDPNEDPKHEGDLDWFNDIHPNDRGTALIAATIVDAMIVKNQI